MTTAKPKTTRSRSRSTKPAAAKPAPAKKAAAATGADFEAFKIPEFNFEAFKMFDMNQFDFAKFDMSKFDFGTAEVPAAYRDFAEKALAQAKEAYAKVKDGAEQSVDLVEDSLEAARDNALDVQMKGMDNAKANTDALYDFWKDMLSVKSVSEAVELQTSFARQQYEMLTSQGKDLQEASTKAVTETFKPVKDAAEKAFKAAA